MCCEFFSFIAERCPILTPPSHGTLDCSHSHGEFSFGSRCTSTCEDGFLLTGIPDTECTSAGTWSTEIPGCQGNKPKHDTVAIHIKSFLICVHTLNSFTLKSQKWSCTEPILVLCYPQHANAPCWPNHHSMGGWTAAIWTLLSVTAHSVTLNVIKVSGWKEELLWCATPPATGIRIHPPVDVSA